MSKSYQRGSRVPSRRFAKVTVSIPSELLTSVDRSAKAASKTRSSVFQEALRAWVGVHEHAILVREYEAGYRRMPEDEAESEASTALAARVLAEEDW